MVSEFLIGDVRVPLKKYAPYQKIDRTAFGKSHLAMRSFGKDALASRVARRSEGQQYPGA
jgi:hypothetical protein